jgi:hypothetical protein
MGQQGASLARLVPYRVDFIFPGHGMPAFADGSDHVLNAYIEPGSRSRLTSASLTSTPPGCWPRLADLCESLDCVPVHQKGEQALSPATK